jgi:hypothetical protein
VLGRRPGGAPCPGGGGRCRRERPDSKLAADASSRLWRVNADLSMTPLTQALRDLPEQEPIPDQPCLCAGKPENLHAVLGFTCVIGPAELGTDGHRFLVRHNQVEVDLSTLEWRLKHATVWTVRRIAGDRGRTQARGHREQNSEVRLQLEDADAPA